MILNCVNHNNYHPQKVQQKGKTETGDTDDKFTGHADTRNSVIALHICCLGTNALRATNYSRGNPEGHLKAI